MSDEYEVVGYVLKKKPDGDGCAGCLGALIAIAIFGACIESCVGGKKNSGNATVPTYTDSAPVAVQTGTPSVRDASANGFQIPQNTAPVRVVEQRVRCRACSGRGAKEVWSTCPVCNGYRKVVDQERTAQSAVSGMMNAFARGRRPYRPPQQRTYYMSCPSCSGKGRIPHREGCGQCGGNGFLMKR